MVSRVIPVDPFDLVVFGGTGDLAQRKILPALYHRFCAGQVPDNAQIIGAARSDLDGDGYRKLAAEALAEFAGVTDTAAAEVQGFLDMLRYVQLDARGEDGWSELEALLPEDRVRAFYLSVAPSLFGDLAERIRGHGLVTDKARVVVEKPFGHDLESAQALNKSLADHFDESQIYRIDHYLGKETVQNLMAIRFGNLLFEPLWNSRYVDHIQLTVAETVGVGGRGEYYDRAGAMRDMVQNHMMQLLCLIAMEPPARFEPDEVRDEKLKVIRALKEVSPQDVVRGQYAAFSKDGEDFPSYRDAVHDPGSTTESYVALKAEIENWRWVGTPFYLRTGKRLTARSSVIEVVFKDTPYSIFGADAGDKANVLSIRLQPNEGITLEVTIKEPGPGGMRLINVPLDMSFSTALGESDPVPDAYERLIMDVIRGNQTLFMRGDEVEAAWAWTDPIITGWETRGDRPEAYDGGSAGPSAAERLLARDGRVWRALRP